MMHALREEEFKRGGRDEGRKGRHAYRYKSGSTISRSEKVIGVPSRCFKRGSDRATGSVWCSKSAWWEGGDRGKKEKKGICVKSDPESECEGGKREGAERERERKREVNRLRLTHLPKHATSEVVVL